MPSVGTSDIATLGFGGAGSSLATLGFGAVEPVEPVTPLVTDNDICVDPGFAYVDFEEYPLNLPARLSDEFGEKHVVTTPYSR